MKPDTNRPSEETTPAAYDPASLEQPTTTQVENPGIPVNPDQKYEANSSGVIDATSGEGAYMKPKSRSSLMRFNKLSFIVTGAVLIFTILAVVGGLYFASSSGHNAKNSGPKVNDFAVSSLKVEGLNPSQELQLNQPGHLDVNGQLKVNNTIVLAPLAQPTNAVTGELYYSQTNNQPYYYNGKQFIGLGSKGVTSIQGQSGDVSFSAGSGISLNGTHILNSGVTDINGTNNQVQVSQSTGSITLSLPQDISPSSTPSFTGITTGSLTARTGDNDLAIGSLTQALSLQGSATTISDSNNGNTTEVVFDTPTSNNVLTVPDVSGEICTSANNCQQTATTGSYINLQASSPGSAQVGNFNISGTAIVGTLIGGNIQSTTAAISGQLSAGSASITGGIAANNASINNLVTAGSFSGDGANITNVNAAELSGEQSSYYLDASNINTGTLADNRLSTDVTLQGNTFNGVNQLVKLDTNGDLPAVSGAALTNLNANAISSGSVAVAYGGTGAITAPAARANLQAAKSGANSDITSLLDLTAITPASALTIGSTSENLTLQGATTILSDTQGGYTNTLSFATPSANDAIVLPNASGTVCLSSGNCSGSGSGYANVSLSNLNNLSINTSLLPESGGAVNLGSSSLPFGTVSVSDGGSYSYTLSGATTTSNKNVILPTFAGATATLCLTTGNCAGAGGGVITSGGTTNTIALFSGTQQIGNSIISQDSGATTITVSGQLTVTGSSNLTGQLSANGGIVTNNANINAGTGSITGNGSNLTNLNGSNVTSGTVADNYLSTDVTLQGNTFNGDSQLVQLTNTGVLPSLSGVNLTNLNGSNVTSGTVADSRLSANVALLNQSSQVFSGTNIFQPTTGNNSVSFFRIQNAGATTTLFDADTTNNRIGIDTATPAYALDVAGQINSSVGISISGVQVCTVNSCSPVSGNGNYIQNITTTQTANFNIQGASSTAASAVIEANSGGTGDILDLINSSGIKVLSVGNTGNSLIKTSTNSTTSFQIQNTAGSELLQADTTDSSIAIAGASTTAGYALNVTGSINASSNVYANGTQLCTVLQCASYSASGNYIQNGTTTQVASFNIQGASTTAAAAVIENNSSSTADILDIENGSGNKVVSVGNTGSTLVQTSTNSTTAFQVQNAAGSAALISSTATGISSPSAPTISPSTTGGTLPAGTYSFALAATANEGTTPAIASSPTSVTTTGTTSSITINWSAVTGASGYELYASANSGVTWYALNAGPGSGVTSYTYTTNGAFNGLATLPVSNTTVGTLNVNGTYQVGGLTVLQTPGAGNTFLGIGASNSTLTGNGNFAEGSGSLGTVSSGSLNVAIGNYALKVLNTGSQDIAIGNLAEASITSSTYNVAIGAQSLQNDSTGNTNAAVGFQALYNVTSSGNTGIGYSAGVGSTATIYADTTGGGNTFLGSNTGFTNTVNQNSYATAIGADSTVGQSNSISLGCTSGINSCSNTSTVSIGSGGYAPNALTVSAQNYSNGSIASSAYTITGTGTAFTSSMNGGTIYYSDGTSGGPLTYVSPTSLTSATYKTMAAGSTYTIVYGGFNVTSNGTEYLQPTTNSTSTFQIQNTAGNSVLNVTTTTLLTPSAPTLTSTSTGGALAANTYYYELAADGANGSTLAVASSPASVTTTGTTSVNTLTWTSVAGATGYTVYRSVNGTTWYGITVSNATTTITDNGSNYSWNVPTILPTVNSAQGNLNVNGIYQINGLTVLQAPGLGDVFGGTETTINTTGTNDTAFGASDFQSLTSGISDTAVGAQALVSNTSGNNDTAVGFQSLDANTTGSANTALGVGSLQGLLSGSSNTASGTYALQAVSSTSDNAAFGTGALRYTTGNNNVALGYYAGYSNVVANDDIAGSDNTFLGTESGLGTTIQNNYSTALGYDSAVSQNNSIALGCTSGVNSCANTSTVSIGSSGYAPNALTVSAQTYATGTITQTTTAITGSGTTFTSSMNGGTIYYSDGTSATITYLTATTLTSSLSKTVTAGSTYTIVYGGFNVTSNGTAYLQPTNNSTTAFQVQNNSGTSVFDVDTTNGRVGIGSTSIANLLSIGALTTAASGYQVAVSTGGVTNSGIVVQTVASQSSGYILQAQNNSGVTLASIDYQGNLSVKAATINGILTINGHVVTGNTSGTTTSTVNANAGTGSTCTVSGNDTGGHITIVTGSSSLAAGVQCTINFASSYSANPNPVISSANSTSTATIQPYVTSATGGFSISFIAPDSGGNTYVFNYFNSQ
jgi:hypothetical protein